ncbi:sigma-54-dependent Fis family transcriptional regulator [Geodermatophilus sabuli]|uniref:Transcriptional regulator of acetoin/glycerol metabolism n=1 Tax=Geodermatophilus sabuli TaxID=1564158 RepID=A0A285EE40_9ACTN|nr:helix-turn-helix domain-containing protein [Geodermatophilus sabuli]MBB3086397.1 transcriptional regulator of acetoin/glycerol metabolism [Geodermatophilus sabuli]SNX97388.1 Transcriptional regulator of acetoin/glycerol metabolism [Geodermatophilus sabuli]
MHQGQEDRRRVAAARAEFLERGPAAAAGVRDLVAASWRRSRSAGVDADEYRITFHEDVDLDSRLVRCARPVIERLAEEMVDVPVAIALSDAEARIVHRLDCSTSVGRLLDRVDFTAGFSFAEGGVGTNGIGTVFEAGSSVAVVGAEHFTEALVAFACTGAPVLDPLTGRVAGVLDVSSLAESWTPLMHTLVRRAAADIGQNLLLDRGHAQRALYEVFARADARPRQAVMAVGASLMVNQRAQQLFTVAEQATIHQHALFLMSRRDRVAETIPLDTGRRVRMRARRVVVGDEVAGMVLLLDEDPGRRPPPVPVPRSAPHAGSGGRPQDPHPLGGRSPGWVTACEQAAAAIDRGDSVLVMGEPGTGRRTLVTELFRRAHPSGQVVADGAARTPGPPLDGAGTATLVVLGDVDRLDADAVERLRGLLASVDRGRVLVAATLAEEHVGAGLPFQALLGHFDQAVTVPPLRFRGEDLPLVVARLLAELAPHRRVRLHPEASRLIARYAWPGNLPQLREALRAALAARPVGEVQPEDLPAYCRTTGGRTLTPLEAVERDTIVRALQRCGGNRVHAAAALGMARSSLYRKIRSYAITDV